jgi:Holliday junction resolvase RusA-like endonuclease
MSEKIQIKIVVPAIPVAQPRAKASTFGGHVKMYTPTSIKNADGSRKPHPIAAFKATVRMAFRDAYKGPPLSGALRCDCLFVMPRPKNLIWKTRSMPRLPHVAKPDRDNLDKAVLDALKGLAWIDDCQVCQGAIDKFIASGYEQPHVVITITEAEIVEADASAQELFPAKEKELIY